MLDVSTIRPVRSTSNNDRTIWHRGLLIVSLVVLALLLGAVVLSAVADGGRSGPATVPDVSARSPQQVAVDPQPRPTEPPSDALEKAEPPALALWPPTARGRRFDDPGEVVLDFARHYVGFAAPSIGVYTPSDLGFRLEALDRLQANGHVEVRAALEGPVTTVAVSRSEDGSWWVMGATSPNLIVADPVGHRPIADPVHVSGRARSASGAVEIQLRAAGAREPLLRRHIVTGGGEEWQPFEGGFGWTDPGAERGAMLFAIRGQDGNSVSEVTVIPVIFPS